MKLRKKPGFSKSIAAVRTFATNIYTLENYFADYCYFTYNNLFGGAFFTAMKTLKSSTRSTMTDERLNGLALMYLLKDFAIEEEDIVTDFSNFCHHNLTI